MLLRKFSRFDAKRNEFRLNKNKNQFLSHSVSWVTLIGFNNFHKNQYTLQFFSLCLLTMHTQTIHFYILFYTRYSVFKSCVHYEHKRVTFRVDVPNNVLRPSIYSERKRTDSHTEWPINRTIKFFSFLSDILLIGVWPL